MKEIEVDGQKIEYGSTINVGQFQKLSGIIGKMSDHFESDDITAGEFAGALAKDKKLVDVICVLLKKDVNFVDKIPYDKVMEVINDFFFTNGLWLMVSGFIPMHSEVSKMLTDQSQKNPKTYGKNLEHLEEKKKKMTK